MPKGGLSYASKEQCIADAKAKGMSPAPCNNLPSKKAGRVQGGGGSPTPPKMPRTGGGMGY